MKQHEKTAWMLRAMLESKIDGIRLFLSVPGCYIHSAGSNKEVMMHMMGRIGFMGLGIALVSCLGGAPVFAAAKPTADRQKIMITSPKGGG